MAHEKVYGICENKCRVEVLPKDEAMSKESIVIMERTSDVTQTAPVLSPNASGEASKTIVPIEGYEPIGIIGFEVSSYPEVSVKGVNIIKDGSGHKVSFKLYNPSSIYSCTVHELKYKVMYVQS